MSNDFSTFVIVEVLTSAVVLDAKGEALILLGLFDCLKFGRDEKGDRDRSPSLGHSSRR